MRAFIDTSTLFKRYVKEKGSDELDKILKHVTEIFVAPTAIIEVYSTIERKIQDKTLNPKQSKWLKEQVHIDFQYYSKVLWNENLIEAAVEITVGHHLRTLDCIQLASAILSDSEIFVTSDQLLYQAASKKFEKSVFI